MFKEKIIIELKEVFKEIPFGIEHTLKDLKNAEWLHIIRHILSGFLLGPTFFNISFATSGPSFS